MRDPDMALSTHAREELGVDPTATGKPLAAAFSSLGSFAVGAFIPLIPWLWGTTGNPILWSILFAGVGTVVVGGAIGTMTRRGTVRWALRQLAITVLAAGVTYGVGRGVGTH
jgi:VIT1/CCC1 family predicted Fe2+/Mn2+ transporter